jgi:hypothetical protein
MTNRFKTVLGTRGPAVRRRLTADVLEALPFASTGQYIVRDTELKGFFVQVGKRSKTLMLQADLRQHGIAKSRRWKLGQHPDTRVREARLVMQRVHVEDLTGFVLDGPEDWTVLKLPAIGLVRERIPIDHERLHDRMPGEVLWPQREPQHVLDLYRLQLGSDIFSAQFQQEPMPPEGA